MEDKDFSISLKNSCHKRNPEEFLLIAFTP
jgi:hypothetical protein